MKTSVSGLLVLVPLLHLLLLMVLSGSISCAAARPLRRETNDRADEALWIGTSDDNKMRKHHRATTLVANEEASYFSSEMGEMEDQEEEEEKGCGSEEEGCRRRMAEAHLDYIYTQHHPHH